MWQMDSLGAGTYDHPSIHDHDRVIVTLRYVLKVDGRVTQGQVVIHSLV
jgi:hypothetical protein